MSLKNSPTFVGLVQYIQTFLSLHILRLHDFKLSDGRRQELCLLQLIKDAFRFNRSESLDEESMLYH